MANKIEVEVRTDDASDYSKIEADAAAAGAKTGAAFEAGSSAPILSLADRMRAGYDNAFGEMEAGTRGFTAAQLGTFSDYYAELSGQGDRSAADMLARTRVLAGDTQVAVKEAADTARISVADFMAAGSANAHAFTQAFVDTAEPDLATAAHTSGTGFTATFSKSVQDSIRTTSVSGILGTDETFKSIGEQAGEDFAEGFTEKAAAPATGGGKTSQPGAGSGKSADSSGGMSGLLAGALTAGVAVGPAAILTGMAAATTAATALVLKSNVAIAADYKNLGADAAASIKAAAAPLAGDLNQSLVSLDGYAKALGPDLKTTFAGAAPDIATLTTGLEGLAGGVLPGVGAALSASQADAVGFANGLPVLGAGIGSFFTGLTRDSATTGAGLQSVMGVVGNTFGTLGTVVGSASSAISADLLAVDPVINTFLTTVRGLASPATVGGLAGAFGAMKLDPSISSGLSSASTKLLDLSDHAGIASGALLKSSGALDTMSGVMGGPWGIAIGAGVGLLSGFVGSLLSASHASDALTLSQQGLSDAIGKDGGNAGQATASYIAQSDAANGLTDSANKAGVSVATWTQAVMGNKDAQSQVTAAVDKLNQAQLGQMTTAAANANVTSHAMGDLQGHSIATAQAAQSTNKLTDANQQLLGSMTAQASQIAGDITKQAELTQATNALNSSTLIFNATMAANYQSMVQSATTSADNSVAALNLGDSQTTLNQNLAAGITQYQLLQDAASGYQAVLTSLNGSTMTADQAQNTLAQDMLTAKTSFKANGESLDLSTQAGINNRQSLTQAATAIQALGIANMNSGGNINSANAIIQQQATAFVNATGATGKAKTAIELYLAQIDQIPPDVSTTVTANTGPAKADVMSFLGWVDSEAAVTGTIQVNMGSIKQSGQGHAYGGITSAAATGGARSSWTKVNEQGDEYMNLPDGTLVMPHANAMAMAANGAGSAGAGGRSGGGGTDVSFFGELDSAFATFFMRLYREGKIQIKAK